MILDKIRKKQIYIVVSKNNRKIKCVNQSMIIRDVVVLEKNQKCYNLQPIQLIQLETK
jgi:hypothetical protein